MKHKNVFHVIYERTFGGDKLFCEFIQDMRTCNRREAAQTAKIISSYNGYRLLSFVCPEADRTSRKVFGWGYSRIDDFLIINLTSEKLNLFEEVIYE